MTERADLVAHARRNGSFAELVDLPYIPDEHQAWYEARFVLDPTAPHGVRYSDNHPRKSCRGKAEFFKDRPSERAYTKQDGTVSHYARTIGYVKVNAHTGRSVQVARVLYRMLVGTDMPADFRPDHINHVRDDNRICNLRLDTMREGNARRRMHVDGSLKYPHPGLNAHPQTGNIRVQWQIGSWTNNTFVCVPLGTWRPENYEQAVAVYKTACAIADAHFTNEDKIAAVRAYAVTSKAQAKHARDAAKAMLPPKVKRELVHA